MDADQVRAYVELRWPGVLGLPLAQAMHGASAMALLEASDAQAVIDAREALLSDAMACAQSCLQACGGWTVETLANNIASALGIDLDWDDCESVARRALEAARPSGRAACGQDGRAASANGMAQHVEGEYAA